MAKKHSKNRKKKSIFRSVFYRIYFCVILLCVAALCVGLNFLWKVMADYEATRPVYVAQDAMKLFEQGDYRSIYNLDTAVSILNREDASEYADYMQSYAQGKTVTWQEAFSGNDTEKKYSVRLDGEKFATFTLSTTGQKSKHNFDIWRLTSITTNVLTPVEYSITVPSDSSVTVNGQPLTESDAVETGIVTKSNGMLPEGLASPTMTKYAFTLCLGTPEISVTDAKGNAQQVNGDAQNGYFCDLPTDDSIRLAFEENIMHVAKKLANYTSEDLSKDRMVEYAAKNSPAMQYIRSFNNEWCPPHTSYDFRDMTTSNYYSYSEDCFSCEVTFQYVIHYKKADDNVYDTKYTLYFTKGKNGYELYNFSMN